MQKLSLMQVVNSKKLFIHCGIQLHDQNLLTSRDESFRYYKLDENCKFFPKIQTHAFTEGKYRGKYKHTHIAFASTSYILYILHNFFQVVCGNKTTI